jgi:hypothetical protein
VAEKAENGEEEESKAIPPLQAAVLRPPFYHDESVRMMLP